MSRRRLLCEQTMILRRKFKLRDVLITCCVLTLLAIGMFVIHVVPKERTLRSLRPQISQMDSSPSSAGIGTTKAAAEEAVDTSLSLFVRMSGKLPDHRQRYYCDLFRTTVLYWPSSYGKIVLVLDEETEEDHKFGDKIMDQTKRYFPDRKLEVLYEALPKDKSTLDFPGIHRKPGYNRQLWSSYFIDLYSNDSIIAWMDNDAAFITPVTKSSIFNGTKLRTLGTGCKLGRDWIKSWAHTLELALGFPMVANFMSFFPVYIYRDTFTHCREYILRKFKTRNFDEVFKKLIHVPHSPVCVVLSYAWYFERDRYDWNFEMCDDLAEYNKKFPTNHTVRPEHVETILSEPQTTFHVPYAPFLSSNVIVSYCLSHKAAGNNLDICSNRAVSLSDNFVLFNHDLQFIKSVDETPCTGNYANTCLELLKRHYDQVGLEIKQGRKVEWSNVKTVEKLASEFNIQCSPMT